MQRHQPLRVQRYEKNLIYANNCYIIRIFYGSESRLLISSVVSLVQIVYIWVRRSSSSGYRFISESRMAKPFCASSETAAILDRTSFECSAARRMAAWCCFKAVFTLFGNMTLVMSGIEKVCSKSQQTKGKYHR